MTTYGPDGQSSNPRKNGKSVLMSGLYDLRPKRSAQWHDQPQITSHVVPSSHFEVKIISNPRPFTWKASTCHPDYQVYFQGSFASFEITVRFCVKKHWKEWRFSQKRCWCRVSSLRWLRIHEDTDTTTYPATYHSAQRYRPGRLLIIMKVSLYPLATVRIFNMTSQSMLDTSCKSVGRSCTQRAQRHRLHNCVVY
jgi:hypothetical protein